MKMPRNTHKAKMTEKMVYGGAILSAGSIIVAGIALILIIISVNAGEELGGIIYVLPVAAVFIVAGIAAILYGSREEEI
ncbi:hypothetical protein J2128_002126 [Methanomicrobium sp. W14]|uniref:hypothetical protein n=1 Tax=Methanomicrobium sp. W14 TaxID=2817839 RepID=UPI001AEA1359|nr:hypothetical protein [Methanomicrobium sp. W14]MBP2134160.1 hypothetical protein [Methanomicrobium sp. W14]